MHDQTTENVGNIQCIGTRSFSLTHSKAATKCQPHRRLASHGGAKTRTYRDDSFFTCNRRSLSRSSRKDKVSASHLALSTLYVASRSVIRSEILLGCSIATQTSRAMSETP